MWSRSSVHLTAGCAGTPFSPGQVAAGQARTATITAPRASSILVSGASRLAWPKGRFSLGLVSNFAVDLPEASYLISVRRARSIRAYSPSAVVKNFM